MTVKKPTSVKVERINQEVWISPPCDEVLASLRTSKHILDKDDRGSLRVKAAHQSLGKTHPSPAIRGTFYPAGLKTSITEMLQRAGHRVIETGDQAVTLPEPVGPDSRGVDPEDWGLLDFVHQHDRGLIHHDEDVNPAWLVGQLRLGYPGAMIAVATAGREDAWRFGKCLKSTCPSAMVVDDRHYAPAGPLVISTFLGLGGDSVDLHKRDMVIVPDAAEVLTQHARVALAGAPQARLYGLLNRSRRIAPHDWDRIQALFGLNEIVIPRHGHVLRAVEVARFAITGSPTLAPGCDLVGLKRQGCWLNPIRNRRVARLADALASGERARIFAASKEVAVHLRKYDDLHVVVIVENVEQALALSQSIPGWTLVVAEPVTTTGLSPRQVEALHARRWQAGAFPNLAIATLAGLEIAADAGLKSGHPLDPDVVIRCDSGETIPDALDRLTITRNRTARPLVLVDLDDRTHAVLGQRGKKRRAAYQAAGWMVDGQWALTFPLDHFFATGSWGQR